MVRRLFLLAALASVLAVAIPAAASGSTGLTEPAGVLVPVDQLIQETSSNFKAASTGVGTLTCNEFYLTGELVQNNSTGWIIKGVSEKGMATTCFRNGTTAITIDHIALTEEKSASSETTTAKVTLSYIAHVGSLNCTFKLTNATKTFTNGGSQFTLKEQPQTVTPAACGAAGNASLSLFLETDRLPPNNTALIIMS